MRDVAFSCDDGGVPYLKVAVWSLISRYAGREPLRVNVFEGWGGHSAAHKAELAELVERFPGATLRYVDVEQPLKPYADAIAPRPGSRWNVFTWTPVFTPMLIPDATGNVIHFDIDMLFNADVSPLFELDLSGQGGGEPRLVACAYEYDRFGDNAGREIWEKGILPLEAERYFNTGVLVFNSEACRAERTWDRIVEWYRAHYDVADRIEQDAWNALYWRRVEPLPVKWNFHDRNLKGYARWPLAAKYWLGNTPRDCMEAAMNPAILHFWGPKKPWKPSHRPYRRLYHAAMREVGLKPPREQLLAPWYDFVNACDMAAVKDTLRIPADYYPRAKSSRVSSAGGRCSGFATSRPSSCTSSTGRDAAARSRTCVSSSAPRRGTRDLSSSTSPRRSTIRPRASARPSAAPTATWPGLSAMRSGPRAGPRSACARLARCRRNV